MTSSRFGRSFELRYIVTAEIRFFTEDIVILDHLDNADLYSKVHPGFAAAFEYLRTRDFSTFKEGKHEIDGERMYLMMNRCPGRGRAGVLFEAHQKYIDIQLTVSGTEEMGWRRTATCEQVKTPYNLEADYALFTDPVTFWMSTPPGYFAIFFPDDAHAPLAAECDLVKAVMKVAVDWK